MGFEGAFKEKKQYWQKIISSVEDTLPFNLIVPQFSFITVWASLDISNK